VHRRNYRSRATMLTTRLGVYQPTDFWYPSMRADDKRPTVRT
jgi:hypothetical protein